MIGPGLTVDLVVMRVIAGVIVALVQGLAIAAAAVLLGDKGPRYDGRLTASPFGHVDLVGLLSLTLSGFGWSRPVAVDPAELRFGRWGLVLVVLAGTVALLAVAALLLLLAAPLLRGLDYTAAITAVAFVREAAKLCVAIALFTLIPIPPLAGAHFLAALGITLPRRTGAYVGWALLIASVFGVTRIVVKPVYDVVAPLLLGPGTVL